MLSQKGSVLLLLLLLPACAPDAPPSLDIPSWAKVAPEQIAEAEKHGVPVAFENDLGMRFVLIPAGTFLMGSPEDEEGRDDDETQHEVTISKPFYMSIYEVTNEQYLRFRPAHEVAGQLCPAEEDGSYPVYPVSCDDAATFAGWLTEQDGRRAYRLPTEAEWEHACRAGTTRPYGFGERPADIDGFGNCMDRSACRMFGWKIGGEDYEGYVAEHYDGYPAASPVGVFKPSRFGIYDMHGNTWEWCSVVSTSSALREEPTGILRGGAWTLYPCRCAERYRPNMDNLTSMGDFCAWGFRLVSPLPDSPQ